MNNKLLCWTMNVWKTTICSLFWDGFLGCDTWNLVSLACISRPATCLWSLQPNERHWKSPTYYHLLKSAQDELQDMAHPYKERLKLLLVHCLVLRGSPGHIARTAWAQRCLKIQSRSGAQDSERVQLPEQPRVLHFKELDAEQYSAWELWCQAARHLVDSKIRKVILYRPTCWAYVIDEDLFARLHQRTQQAQAKQMSWTRSLPVPPLAWWGPPSLCLTSVQAAASPPTGSRSGGVFSGWKKQSTLADRTLAHSSPTTLFPISAFGMFARSLCVPRCSLEASAPCRRERMYP